MNAFAKNPFSFKRRYWETKLQEENGFLAAFS